MTQETRYYLPVISRNEFPLLSRIMDAKFQAEYRTWADWVAQHERWAEANFQILPVRIKLSEFAGGRRLRNPPDLAELLRFAESQAETLAA